MNPHPPAPPDREFWRALTPTQRKQLLTQLGAWTLRRWRHAPPTPARSRRREGDAHECDEE